MGIEKLISILENYGGVMQSNGVTKKHVFATSSLRRIDNPDKVVDAVKKQAEHGSINRFEKCHSSQL